MALYANLGHNVVAVSLTRGDSSSIARSLGMPNQELAAKRSAHAVQSCQILKSRMVFLDQVNGDTMVNESSYKKFGDVLMDQKPAIVFTHWPIDTHRDHRTASLLTYDAWFAEAGVSPSTSTRSSSALRRKTLSPTITWISLKSRS